MRYYIAVVEKDEGSAYGLSFPDLPGCFSAADDWADIPSNASDALDLWFEDAAPTDPRPMAEIAALDEVRAAVANGAMLMAVPYIPAAGEQVRANISLDRGLLSAIDETARSRHMTRSSFLASLARREIAGF